MRRLFAWRATFDSPKPSLANPRLATPPRPAEPPPPRAVEPLPLVAEWEGTPDPGVQTVAWQSPARWEPAWDAGIQVAVWNHESAQPAVDLVLVRDAGAPRLAGPRLEIHGLELAGRRSA